MRLKFDMNVQRQVWVPSRPNKRIRKKIAEIDRDLLSRANGFGGEYQPLDVRIADLDNNNQQQPEIIEEKNEPNSEGESQILR